MLFIYAGVFVSAFIWLWIIYRNDRYEPEPLKVIIYLLFAGGLLSSIPSSLCNVLFAEITGFMDSFINNKTHLLGNSELAVFSLFVGFNEEFFKSIVTILLVRKLKDFNEPLDALIYSMTVSLGFAAYENIQYAMMGGISTLILRSLTSVPLHIGLASIWGMGMARSKFINGNLKLSNIFKYIAVAAVIHAVYDFIQFKLNFELLSFAVAFMFAVVLIKFSLWRMKIYLYDSPFVGVLRCRNCGYDNPLNTVKCERCGEYMTFRFYKICIECGTRNGKTADRCCECGKAF